MGRAVGILEDSRSNDGVNVVAKAENGLAGVAREAYANLALGQAEL
jgi:hypothetical protein